MPLHHSAIVPLALFALAVVGCLACQTSLADTFSSSGAAPRSESVSVPAGGPYLFTQNTDPGTVTTGNSVSCNGGTPDFFHADNSYLRRFDLDGDHAATGTVNLTNVSIGVEQSTPSGATQPIELRLYSIPNASALTFANLSLIATEAVDVGTLSAAMLDIPVSASIDGVANDLVVEVFTPDGQTALNTFFMGSNAAGQTGPSFLAASTCGIAEPTDTAGIGFPNMHVVMTVTATSLPVELQEFSIQ